MKMFHWYSKALADYANGDIIVLAESPEQARELARAEALVRYKSDNPDYDPWVEERALFLEDILAAPTEHAILLIAGSA